MPSHPSMRVAACTAKKEDKTVIQSPEARVSFLESRMDSMRDTATRAQERAQEATDSLAKGIIKLADWEKEATARRRRQLKRRRKIIRALVAEVRRQRGVRT